jgi:predicted Zn finger-like uncharacterized protein
MDVRCNRCGTEYEFDDALISERGTTVKCTNCGFQFKIFPVGAGSAPERWVVRTTLGRELVYTSLRDLQRAIVQRQVEPNDLLSRGNQPPRALRTIAELEPFFTTSASRPSAGERERTPRTLHGVAPPANSVGGTFRQTPAHEPPPSPPEPPTPRPTPPSPQIEPDAPPKTEPAGPPLSATRPEPNSAPASPAIESRAVAPVSHTLIGPDAFPATQPTPSAVQGALSQTLPLAQDPTPGSGAAPRAESPESSYRAVAAPAPAERGRAMLHSYDELTSDEPDSEHASRRARSRWIAALVLAGMVGLVALTVGRRYLSNISPAADKAERPPADKRIAQFLAEGNRLLDEGDLEGAQEQFVKATALAEKDPAVLAALARLATLRADVFWLKLRLLDPSSQEIVQATHRELGRRVGKARSAVDQAFAVAPEDPAVLRARIDTMRLSGDGDKAREWVGPISGNASQPENAYVLAALDLADQNPVWPSVIERLRAAAAGEREPGRARATLIYALVRASRLGEADSEFKKLEASARPHALLDELKGFLERHRAAAGAESDAGKQAAAVDPRKLPVLDTSSPSEPEAKRAPAERPSGDFRAKLTQAAAAVRAGRLDEAEQLFNAVLVEQPGNVEAVAGLGDVARRRGDSATANRMYDRVLQQNPSYLPALLASADHKWDSGDRKGAVALYKRVVEQAGPGSEYGSRAAARIAQSEAAPEPAAAPEAPRTPPPAPAEAEPGAE